METIVRSRDTCYSACALAFMGGAEWLRDVGVDPNRIPNQLPARSIERGAVVGFHAPYLNVPEADYSSEKVQGAYRMAVDSIAALIQLSDYLYIESEELPRLLEPDQNSAFTLDTVDAVRTLWVDYADYSLQTRNLPSITQTMVMSACINRWYHSKRRSALPGYAVAAQTLKDFDEGSELLGNDETGKAFGVRAVSKGTVTAKVAYLPITMTQDQKNFIWCVFSLERDSPSIFYRSSGSIAELFEPIESKGGLWELEQAEGTVRPEAGLGISQGMLRVLDMVPADTKLDEVETVVEKLSQSEVSLLAGVQ
ncbi:hypothetical protein EOB36_20015 [Mesorhizobium sp. M6A.T.Cr.TU.017.01.1.1]|uniref:hypothetical protein n=1 Tax=Mesorhizobium sp. M6A.T.Cr.TU.017.01.1.1 TaxID=2496774 RepID=UPI000FD4B3E0|nr:hypothetical protein [Mesorhizobium sp. M6A.T.Cr.TU.017.01.1.1]RUU99564.1 hypothetical protein EOB36_20015 [Mesorhizobium sp. M6A.T.Cr.TU.017.01.1.1]